MQGFQVRIYCQSLWNVEACCARGRAHSGYGAQGTHKVRGILSSIRYVFSGVRLSSAAANSE
jgi:hypothetical protein